MKKFEWIKLKTEYPVFSEKVKAKILNEIELEENKQLISQNLEKNKSVLESKKPDKEKINFIKNLHENKNELGNI